MYSLIYTSENFSMIAIRTLALLAYIALAYLTYRRNIIACWVMIIFLMLSGVSTVFFGIFAVAASQYLMKLFSIVVGIYFSYGAFILFRAIQKGKMTGIDSLMKKA